MSRPRTNLLYIVGAGRSGTSILAAMLGTHINIAWLGEFIHLARWRESGSVCSCGQALRECPVWRSRGVAHGLGHAMQTASEFEDHRNVLPTLLGLRKLPEDYCDQQDEAISGVARGQEWLIDSSKHTGRALGLARCAGINAKFIYLVRDPRGVVHSFDKNAQTRRNTVSACFYYLAINFLAQIAVWTRLRGRYLKIRYEDFAIDPERALTRIAEFLNVDLSDVGQMAMSGATFMADHIAGGNRWTAHGPVEFQADMEWREQMSRSKQLLIYLMCFPFQIINRYGI